MNKRSIIPLLLLFANSIFGQERIEFKVGYSELYATYDFIEKISDFYPENTFKTEFLNSKYNTNYYKQKVFQIDTLRIDFNYFFNQYAPTLKSSLASRSLLEKNLITSKTLVEFKKKSFGIIPNEELNAFSEVIEVFLPVYNDLIFRPNKGNFETQLTAINIELSNNAVSKIFNDVMKFYGIEWDYDIPFEVIAFPTIGRSGIGARAFLNISVIRFPLDFKSYDILFSVMLHEIFHIGYDSQPIAFKNDLKTWFKNTKSNNSAYAFLLLNEVLATSLGNGYAYEQLRNKRDKGDWYYLKYVNLMAKEIYPTIKLYMDQGKTIDEKFIKTYINIYDEKFPEWTNELDNILSYRVILCDSADDTRYFRRNYPYTFHRSITPITLSGIEEMKKQPLTKVVIISNSHKVKLNLLRNHFESLKKYKLKYKKEFIKVMNLNDGTKLILINKYNSTIETLMKIEFNDRKIKTLH